MLLYLISWRILMSWNTFKVKANYCILGETKGSGRKISDCAISYYQDTGKLIIACYGDIWSEVSFHNWRNEIVRMSLSLDLPG